MKKTIYITMTAALLSLSGCNDVLDTQNIYQKDLNSFYSTPTEIDEALAGVYNAIYVADVKSEEGICANIFDDLMLGGGGDDDKYAKYLDTFQDPTEDTYKDLWVNNFTGIYRCNALIEVLPQKDYNSYFKSKEEADAFKAQALGEAYFMRAFYMFRAAKFFGGIPLIIRTDTPRDIARSSIPETYSRIISDLKTAIESFPNKSANDYTLAQFGHANKWIAEGYMARVYLYYTGYMTNIEKTPTTDVDLPDNQGKVTKSDVINWLKDCIDNSGYSLVSDYRNLWPYSYVNEEALKHSENGTTPILPWADSEGLKWAGQDGIHSTIGTGNPEVMFSERFSYGSWNDNTANCTNRMCLFLGIRDNALMPFYTGWGWGPVNSLFFDDWSDSDKRKLASVIEMGKAEQGTKDYKYKTGDNTTYLCNKKYTSLAINGSEGIKGMFSYIYGAFTPDMQLWHAQDFYYMRFADILLMHSELTETADGLNKVRERAGLEPIEYSLEALKKERMYEFAFEGLRWFDLVRWGDVETNDNYYAKKIDVLNTNGPAEYSITYRPETKGLISIPESEIRLSNGVYKQNPGW